MDEVKQKNKEALKQVKKILKGNNLVIKGIVADTITDSVDFGDAVGVCEGAIGLKITIIAKPPKMP